MANRRKRQRQRQRQRESAEKSSSLARESFRAIFGMEAPEAFNLEDIQDSIKKSLWLAVSIYRLATAISNIGVKVIRTKTKEEASGRKADDIRRVIRKPTLDDTYMDLVEKNMIHLALSGEAYLEKVTDGLGQVVELWTHNPKRFTPKADPTGNRLIGSYVFRSGAEEKILPAESIISVRVYNPNDPLRGMSMVSPMWQDILGDQAAAEMNKATLRRGGRVGGILSPKDGSLGEEEFKRLESSMRHRHEGPENSGKLMLLPADMQFQEAASTNKDMDFLNLRKFAREIAAGGIGVPPMLVGNFDSASYANAKEQLRAFWDYVAKPWLKKILCAFTEQWIRPVVDENLELAADTAQIDALVDNQTARTQNVSTLVQGGIMMVNEGRREVGLPPLPGGDKLLVPLNLTPQDPEDLEALDDGEPDDDVTQPGPPPDESSGSSDREEALGILLQKQRDRDTARAAHEHQLVRAERKLARRVVAYFKGARSRIASRILAQGDGAVDVDSVVGNRELESHLAMQELAPAILETIQDAGEVALTRMGMDKLADGQYRRKIDAPERLPEMLEVLSSFSLDNPRVLGYVERILLTHLEDLSSRTLDDLREALGEGLELGEGVNQLVLRIEAMPAFDTLRAERIARTETIAAFNLGTQEAFRAAGTPNKSWLVTPDERARISHLDADSVYRKDPIPVTSKFTLSEAGRGSAELAFPGDPEAPAWAVVNCRCAMIPEDEVLLTYWVGVCKAELEEVYAA